MAGYWGYDLGRQLEKIPTLTKDDTNTPDMMIGIYTNILTYHHATKKMTFIIHAENEIEYEKEKRFLQTIIALPKFQEEEEPNNTQPEWTTTKSEKDYKQDIQTIIDHIYEGDVYQVNLSRRFEAKQPKDFDEFEHYKTLREHNPAPFSAFMNFGALKLASCSPERFLSVQNGQVETRPIKGTMESSAPAKALQNSAKDHAENIMIVDLMRNDISKVCEYHSVQATTLCAVETFKGLHHLVSTITGTLSPDKTPIDLLKACFPGGSITGAPKIRAMEIIEQLEPHRRGVYCGTMGYIGFDGTMDTSIIIRTLIYTNDKIYLQTGGGITCESTPNQELQETLTKADKIFESFKT